MGKNNISFEEDYSRGQYSRRIGELLGNNNLNWYSSPSVKKPEIFIRPKSPPEENFRSISRISLQIKDNAISFGISGYFPYQIDETKKILENKGYSYHDKGHGDDGRPKGRWWLTKSFDNLESVVEEFKSIEPIIEKSNSCRC